MFDILPQRCIGCGSCTRVCPMGALTMEDGRPVLRADRRCILCMHCAAICPKEAVHFTELAPGEDYPPAPEDPLEALVMSRRSVRKFLPRLPERELIRRALDAASYAPSGKNRRDHRWTVIYGREAVQSVTDQALAFCRETGEAPELPKLFDRGTDLLCCGAPCVIVVWSPDDALNPVIDPAAALTTAELLLNRAGLSTCWGGYLRQISDRSPLLRQRLGIPDGCHMRAGLMVGYAAPAERYRHIPYRPAAEAVWVEE